MYSVKKSPHNPILSPDKDHLWEELSTCNGSPIRVGDKTYILYRAIADPDKMGIAPGLSRSTIGLTWSKNDIDFPNRIELIKPEESWEKFGCEDPRVTEFEGKYYIFYTALSNYPLNSECIKVAVGISDDLKTVKERHLVTPFNAKAMALFPERINGKIYVILSVNTDKPPAEIAIRELDNIEELFDEEKWKIWYNELDKHKLHIREKDSDHVEVGAVPVKTKYGWLLIYSYIQNYFSQDKVFGVEALLLDSNNPSKIIAETRNSIFVPEEVYEKYGFVQDITFPSGALLNGDYLDIYYGASDTTTCKATLKLENLINSMLPERRYSDVKRNPKNPILTITGNDWENRCVFNPAAIDLNGEVHILYRSQSVDGTSYVGYAKSKDGFNIDFRQATPAYAPKEDFEQKKSGPTGNSGCEDPRISIIGDTLYMCYTAYDGVTPPRVAVTTISKADFLNQKWNWKKSLLVTPEGVDDKDACILPERVNGKLILIHRVAHCICMDELDSLEVGKSINHSTAIMEPRKGMWDSKKIGLSSTPHKLPEGWLMFYHGICDDGIYRMGAALLDLEDPTHVISRNNEALFEPEMDYEKVGEVNNVVFPCGSVIRGDDVFIYYGGADKVVGVAKMSLKYILNSLIG